MKPTIFYFILLLLLFCSCNQSDKSTNQTDQKNKTVLLKTVHGNIYFKLDFKGAPNTTTRFIELVQDSFYDRQIFYNFSENKFIETGDPTKTGKNGSGKSMPIEKNDSSIEFGTLIMAPNPTDPNLVDSRFLIILNQDSSYISAGTVFGQLTRGREVLQEIQYGDKILSISIE